ncbi:MAG: HflC protein [Deltaproteobacteria bacterium RBG_13_61_14]|nr:MAG: HflC protein [Deltaproteobacteria bacterium RBG_13_61_14]
MNPKQIPKVIGLVALVVVIATLSSGFYTVMMHQQVIITQFQRPVGDAITEPGLHWKTPFIQEANYFEKRWLAWDGDPNQIPTLDKKYIWVDLYARWRISDPLLFFQRVRNEEGAQSRLDDILDGETRIGVSKYNLIEIIRSSSREFEVPTDFLEFQDLTRSVSIKHGRAKIMDEILVKARESAKEYGIELVDVRIKRINYIPEVREKVYERMISERKRIAMRYRSEGRGESAKILGDMDKELKRIRSEAYRTSQEIKGKADAEAIKIYAQAYNKDPEFYSFWKTMETYRQTVDKDTWLILTTEGEFFKYLKSVKD